MTTDTQQQQNQGAGTLRWQYVFTRMVPTAVIVFFILFMFYPRFGNPISNLRQLGQGADTHLSAGKLSTEASTVATGLQQLQESGALSAYLAAPDANQPNPTLLWDEVSRVLSISSGNSVVLSGLTATAPAPTQQQILTRVGSVLTLSGGGSVDLANYLDNTDSQQLALAGNTLSLGNGGSVNLAGYLDNTDALTSLSCTAGQIPQWSGTAWTCVDTSGGTDSQNLTWNSGANVLSISGGNTVNLGSLLDNTDAQALSKTGDTLSISGNVSTVDLASYLDNTDAQTVNLVGTTLTISGGNSINLAPINTDSQNLSLSGTTLNISGGAGVNIASINTDALAMLNCAANQIAKWNATTSTWGCAADDDTVATETQVDGWVANNGYLMSEVDGSITNEIQSLSLVSDILSISGHAATVDLGGYLDNTDAQAISKTGNTLKISGNASTVDLSAYLDNTDTLAILSCANNQVAKWNTSSSAWVCATDIDTVLSEAQVDAYVGNNGYLTSFSEVDGSTTNELQDLNLSGNVLTITGLGSPANIDLSGYLDNTDALAVLTCSDGKIVKRVSGVWACGDDIDTKLTEAEVDGFVVNNGYLTSEVDGSTTNEIQDLSLSGNTLSLSGAGTTVDLSAYVNTDVLAGLSCSDGQLATWNSTVSLWECAADTDTTYSSGTGISINGSNVISSTLGTSIGTSELDVASVTFAKLASNSCSANAVMKFDGSVWYCGTDIDTQPSEATIESYIFDADNTGTLSSGTLALGSLSYTGTLADANISDALTISSSGAVADGALSSTVTKLGQTIESTEITDGTVTGTDLASATIQFSNIAQNGCTNGQVLKWSAGAWTCAADATGGLVNSFETITTTSGTSPVADSSTDALTLSAGSGVTITGDGTTDTITVAATLGADISSAEIVDGTIVSADISDGSVTNVDLANSSLTVTAGTGLTGGGTVALGGTITLNLAHDFGASVDSNEITNGTILFADLGQNGCANEQVIKWDTTTWTCGADIDTVLTETQVDAYANNNGYLTSEVDGSTTNELQNIFQTIVTPDSGDPVADSATDTLTLANGSGIAITSNNTTDIITIAATLGTDITSSEIVDGTIDNIDLANSSVTLTAGNGLGGAGAVSLGGTTTLNIGAGNGITVNADDIAVQTFAATDALSTTSSSGSGIEVLASGVGLLQGCADAQVLKWNEASDVWACAADNNLTEANVEAFIFDADNTGILSSGTLALGSLSYTGELADAQISGTITVSGTGSVDDAALSSNVTKLGQTIETGEITDGTIAAADIAPDSLNFTELNDALSLDAATTISLGANNFTVNLDSTGEFMVQDGGTIAFEVSNAGNIYIGDTGSAIATGAALVLDSITTEDNVLATNGAIYYNTSLAKFRCYESSTWKDCISAPASQTDTTTAYYFFTELVGNQTTTGSEVFATNATGSTTAFATTAANRPGLYRSTTGASATGRTAFASSASAIALGGGSMAYETSINITALSNSAQRYQLVVGLFDTASAANQVDAVAFVYDEGGVSTGSAATPNWQIMTASNSVRSFNTTTIAVAAATWYKLRVEVNAAGTLATYYINGTNVGTRNTNIPTGATRALGFGHLLIKSIGNTASTVDIDYMKAQQTFTTAR